MEAYPRVRLTPLEDDKPAILAHVFSSNKAQINNKQQLEQNRAPKQLKKQSRTPMVMLSPSNSLSSSHSKPINISPSSSSTTISLPVSNSTRRNLLLLASSSLLSQLVPSPFARALEIYELEEDEKRVVRLFQETSQSVVFIKDLQLQPNAKTKNIDLNEDDSDDLRVEGTGSGFVWDDFGHIVTNYHVVAKLASDQASFHKCKIYFKDSNGGSYAKEGKLVGFDPSYDLAVLKVEQDGNILRKLIPSQIGTSKKLKVGQSCFAIGNPYGFEQTLTTGIVSGVGREIPSQTGRPIRGAIQTDASINAGNSGGPLIDSYGHVIGVNTATFTRKGSGMSSGVNFAIPIDIVVRIVPYLIVYGTSVNNRF